MKYFPESNSDIQQAYSGNRSAHPPGSDYSLYRLHAGLPRGVQKKIIVTPIAQPQRALRNPRQQRKHNANFKAEDDVKNNA